jgi:uncharacterized protein (DUF1778 family)
MTDEELEDFKKMCENPEKIILSKENFDALVEKLNEPPQYNEKIARVLQRKAPWEQ